MVLLSGIYLGLLYGAYVPDWQFEMQEISLNSSLPTSYTIETVLFLFCNYVLQGYTMNLLCLRDLY